MLCSPPSTRSRRPRLRRQWCSDVIRGSIGFDGPADERRHVDGRAVGHARRAQRARRSRPAAMSCSTATASSTRCARSADASPQLAGEAARRADARACRCGTQPDDFDVAAARAAFRQPDGGASPSRRERSHRMTAEDHAVRSRDRPSARSDEPALVVDVEGFEGPLDLLLTLARQQKVDLAKISILALADQYLAFIEEARAAAARARRRLSGDGGLARLSEVAPAAAREQRRRKARAPRTWRPRWRFRLKRLEAFREVAQKLIDAPAARPRRVRPRRIRSRSPTSSIRNGRRRSTICSRPMRCSARSSALAHVRFAQAHGLVAGRGARRRSSG